MRALVAAFFALIAWHGEARIRSVPHPPPQRILWIGAHSDDEALVAPILGPACVEGNAACLMVVMTRGAKQHREWRMSSSSKR